jgi:hypothetical protein
MHSDEGYRHTNYYVRFRELLGLEGGGMPVGFQLAMHELWEDLSKWLDEDQRMIRGRSTIRTHRVFHNIGYPISQALFRQSDVNRLSRLFDALGLPPFSAWDPKDPPISKTELRIHYRIWALTAPGLSPGARELAKSDNYQSLLEEILWAAVKQWRRAEAAPGVAITYLAIGFSPFPNPTAHFWIRRREAMPELLNLEDGRIIRASSERWYDSSFLPIRVVDLENGVEHLATGGGATYAIEYDPAHAIPLREDPILGEWVEVRRVEPNEPHWVLCAARASAHLEKYLADNATGKWALWRPAPGLRDWLLYRDVEIIRTAPILTYPELWRLRPTAALSLSFKGGLRLRHLGTNVYLTDGAPDLWIPPGTATVGDSVEVDGISYEGPGEEGGEFKLNTVKLAQGHHEVKVGERRTSIHLVETSEAIANPEAGSLGLTLSITPQPQLKDWRVGPFIDTGLTDVTVSGGVIIGTEARPPHRPVSLRTSASESFVLGASPAHLSRAKEPEEPPWLAKTDLLPSRFDYRAPFEPVWTLQRFSNDYWRVDCVGPDTPPELGAIDNTRTALDWAGLIIINESAVIAANQKLGKAYVAAARRIYGE